MKVYYVVLGIIVAGLYISACSNSVHTIKPDKNTDETITINIDTNANKDCVKIFIDNVQVDMETLKSLARKTKDEAAQKRRMMHHMNGTF